MLADQILKTIKFFDAQQMPLTLMEVRRFLLADDTAETGTVPLGRLAHLLEILQQHGQVVLNFGFYMLPGRESLALRRIRQYQHGLLREERVKRHRSWLHRIPFVSAVGLTGSQAFGDQKPNSDIDLLVITNPQYLFLARLFLTFYFQLASARRHGTKIANRFCLNHYTAGAFVLSGQTVYTALEYTKLRPIVGVGIINQFKQKNVSWMAEYFLPNTIQLELPHEDSSIFRQMAERLLDNRFGKYLEGVAKKYQLGRIQTGNYIRASDTELAFHPDSKEVALVRSFSEL